MAAGKPFPFDLDICNEICDKTATSRASLATILQSDNRYPGVTTFYKWLDDNDIAAKMYTRAKECQADYLADEIIEIADTCFEGTKIKRIKKGGKKLVKEGEVSDESEDIEETTGDMVDRSRLMIDARKWVAAKLKPKKYGDKLDLTSDGDKLSNAVIILPAKNTDNSADTMAEKA